MASLQSKKIKYIYELPYLERSELCKILNQQNKWEDLAGIWMKYDMLTIHKLRTEKNPTDELLTLWSIHNHTIEELFILLSKMDHYRAMTILKRFVDSKLYILIENGEGSIRIACRIKKQLPQSKYSKIGPQNFNNDSSTIPPAPKIILNNNNSVKILNQSGINQQPLVSSNSNNLLVASPTNVSPNLAQSNRQNEVPPKPDGIVLGKAASSLPQIPYIELAAATDGWNANRILGKGGFGTVYRGTWKNTDVAIKKIEHRGPRSDVNYVIQLQQSFTEITILNSRPHENILLLYAYSIDDKAPCLVYQFMRNGSLEDRLHLKHRTQPLTWLQRYEIAIGTARGLQYLHTIGEKPLIHGDIKSGNILLDKNFEPRIGDFGLAREGSAKDSMKLTRIQGTRAYLPDEFIREKRLSTKIDTYSYGIVMFELATGLQAYDNSLPKNKFLRDRIDIAGDDILLLKDKKAGSVYTEIFRNLIMLGKWCSNRLEKDRPDMESVYRKLIEASNGVCL